MNGRNGQRMPRGAMGKKPQLGYYLIVTDTKETEKNYFLGIRDHIPPEEQKKIAICVKKAETKNLVDEALDELSADFQFRSVWIVFDRDEVKDFDEIVKQAENNHISVAWSNPCIETWFAAYFGVMPVWEDSVTCCSKFADLYKKKTGSEYVKSEKDIYKKLLKHGDEAGAIALARQKTKEHLRNGKEKPSEQCPASAICELVDEIRSKIDPNT